MPGDIVEYTTRYGDWYPNSHIDEVNENGISICEVASIPYVSKHNGKLYLSSINRKFYIHFKDEPNMPGYRIFASENAMAFRKYEEYLAWLKTYKGVDFKTETGTVIFLYCKQELLIPRKYWVELSLPIDTRLMNGGLIDIKYQIDDKSKVITEYHYTNQNDCKICHYEKPYGTASESF